MKNASVVLGAALLSGLVGLVGCSKGASDDEAVAAPEVTSADQLGGRDMAAGTYSLTFDDGPGPRTEELANYLGDKGIVATFFINGKNAPGREAALDAIKARGHILANHTQNHEDMKGLYDGALYHAVADTDAVIAQYQPQGPWLLRAPYGSWDVRVSSELNESDMKKYVGSIFWNVGGQLTESTGADWDCWNKGLAVDDCGGRYLSEMQTRGRGIILMHDTHSQTIDMTKMIVEQFGAEHFVSILNAPQVAAGVGVAPPPSPRPPPPAPNTGCGNVDYKGNCEKNKLTWCENGQLKTAECAERGKVCSLVNATEGHDCVERAPCGDATYAGACAGSVLTWCDETGALRSQDCGARGRRCALESDANGYNCMP